MRWRERILRWVAECHGAVTLAALFALVIAMIECQGGGEQLTIGVWMMLAALVALSWLALLTAAAHALWGIGWREAGRSMAKSSGRGALLLIIAVAAVWVIIRIEGALQPALGIRSVWY